ncbi:MAG: hypothetical protein D6766_06195 [Verrucomicrobia bacterium]|nr:MAG: hypothetical protein D6766_06195 [Verrucomicrobiota bacterium]
MLPNDRRPLPRRLPGGLTVALALLAVHGLAAGAFEWLWSNPLPHGNTVYDMTADDGLQVQVGDRGQLYSSHYDYFWRAHETGTRRSLRGVCFFGNQVLVCGQEGLILGADRDDLDHWTLTDLGTTDWLEGIASGAGMALAVGDNGALYRSTDGVQWTRAPLPTSEWLRSIAFGTPGWVIVGENGALLFSADGVNWSLRSSRTTEHLNRVAWTGSRFVAVGNAGVVITSLDGRSWTRVGNSGAQGDLFTVSGNGSTILIGGAGELRILDTLVWRDQIGGGQDFPAPSWTYYASTWDGNAFTVAGRIGMTLDGFKTNVLANFSWFEHEESPRFWLWDVCRREADGLYVAVGDLGTILSSPDGLRWTQEAPPPEAASRVLLGVAARDDRFVVVGTQGTILTSTDAVSWTAATSPSTNDLQGVTVWNGRFHVAGGGGEILTSADGLNWSVAARPVPTLLSGLAALPERLVAVGDQGVLLTSEDGVQWTPHPLATTNWLYKVRALPTGAIAVGDAGTLLTSPDGLTWTAVTVPTDEWLTDVAALGSDLVAVGTGGTVLRSADSVNWEPETAITREALFGAAGTEDQLVVVGVEGIILRAQRRPLRLVSFKHTGGTNTVLYSARPGATVETLRSTDLNTWETVGASEVLDHTGTLLFQSATNGAPAAFFRGRLP